MRRKIAEIASAPGYFKTSASDVAHTVQSPINITEGMILLLESKDCTRVGDALEAKNLERRFRCILYTHFSA